MCIHFPPPPCHVPCKTRNPWHLHVTSFQKANCFPPVLPRSSLQTFTLAIPSTTSSKENAKELQTFCTTNPIRKLLSMHFCCLCNWYEWDLWPFLRRELNANLARCATAAQHPGKGCFFFLFPWLSNIVSLPNCIFTKGHFRSRDSNSWTLTRSTKVRSK